MKKNAPGLVVLKQTSVKDGEYADVKTSFNRNAYTIDADFTAFVYPKYIKIISDVNPEVAELTVVK